MMRTDDDDGLIDDDGLHQEAREGGGGLRGSFLTCPGTRQVQTAVVCEPNVLL